MQQYFSFDTFSLSKFIWLHLGEMISNSTSRIALEENPGNRSTEAIVNDQRGEKMSDQKAILFSTPD
jgi:hypothetical protein